MGIPLQRGTPISTIVYQANLNVYLRDHKQPPTDRESVQLDAKYISSELKGLVAYCLSMGWFNEAKALTERAVKPLDRKELHVLVFNRIIRGQPEKTQKSVEKEAISYAVNKLSIEEFQLALQSTDISLRQKLSDQFYQTRKHTIRGNKYS